MTSSRPSNADRVGSYYRKTESRVGYQLLLGGTKHFGCYESGQSRWAFTSSMRQMEDQLAERLNLPVGSTVLDAGSGVGDVACRLAGAHGLRVHGVDLLEENVTEARKRADRRGVADRTEFTVGDYSRLGFGNSGFDGVYTVEAFVHCADVEAALATFHRLLRPGGRLVMLEYAHAPYSKMDAEAADAIRTVIELAEMPAFDRFEYGVLEQLLTQAGFRDVTVEGLTARMLPMLSAFKTLARGPYALGRALRLEHRMVNAMSAVEFWKHRGQWAYNVYSAHKGT